MKKLSICLVVYNEAHRIEGFIKSCSWCDDIVIIDKSSTDGTGDIIKACGAHLITMPYSDCGDELRAAIYAAKNEWILCMTASNLIDIRLAIKMNVLINEPSFDADYFDLPFKNIIMGVYSPHSPYSAPYQAYAGKKSAFVFSGMVHEEVKFKGKCHKIERESEDSKCFFYHQTHPTLDKLLERAIRYNRHEVNKYTTGEYADLKKCAINVLRLMVMVPWRKKTWKMNIWDGLAMYFAYINYVFLTYLFVWEKYRCVDVAKKYSDRAKALHPQPSLSPDRFSSLQFLHKK